MDIPLLDQGIGHGSQDLGHFLEGTQEHKNSLTEQGRSKNLPTLRRQLLL
jgi:hypothetical protein